MVGWKFFNLQAMWKNKIPVPPFFCLTRNFYEEKIKRISGLIEKRLQCIDFVKFRSIQDASEDIKKLILSIDFTENRKKEILFYFDQHFAPDTLVSVRSSAIGNRVEEGEDSKDNPFAGMNDSFLYVKREHLFKKILLCWASGYNAESILYKYKQNLPLTEFGMAVGIQKMIFGERSFVLFTCNPQNISRDSVIVAGYGIGEGVVQETVEVDHYFINARTSDIKSDIHKKTQELIFHKLRGWGLKKGPVAHDKQNIPCLNNYEIDYLVKTGKTLEKIFKTPQDIEGTINRNGDIYFIQSRPIAIEYTRCRLWSSANVSESFPGLTTPLTYSFARTFYQLLNYDYLRRCGVKERYLHNNRESLNCLIGYIDGRIYHSISSFFDMLTLFPLFENYRQDWERLVAELKSFYNNSNQREKKIWPLMYSWAVVVFHYFTLDAQFKKFQQCWDNLMLTRRGKKYHSQHPLALVSDYHKIWREAGNWWGITLINYQYIVFFHKLIEKFIKKWKLDRDHSLLSNLLCGDNQFMGVEIVLSAVRLSDMVKNDPVLLKIFQKKKAGEIWEYIKEKKINPNFIKKVTLHLYHYGDRGLQELKFRTPEVGF